MSNSIPEREGHAASPRADAWYQVTLAAIGDAVLTTDPNGVVTYMNPVAETLTGWPADEALGKHLEDVFRIVNEETRKLTGVWQRFCLKWAMVFTNPSH